MALDPVALAGIVSGGGAIGWMIYKDRIERKRTREHGLSDNPERCAQHEIRLTQMEERFERMEGQNREDHGKMFDEIGQVKQEVARLSGKLSGK